MLDKYVIFTESDNDESCTGIISLVFTSDSVVSLLQTNYREKQ